MAAPVGCLAIGVAASDDYPRSPLIMGTVVVTEPGKGRYAEDAEVLAIAGQDALRDGRVARFTVAMWVTFRNGVDADQFPDLFNQSNAIEPTGDGSI